MDKHISGKGAVFYQDRLVGYALEETAPSDFRPDGLDPEARLFEVEYHTEDGWESSALVWATTVANVLRALGWESFRANESDGPYGKYLHALWKGKGVPCHVWVWPYVVVIEVIERTDPKNPKRWL